MLRLLATILIALYVQGNNINLRGVGVTAQHDTVAEQTVEGYTVAEDYYIVVLDNGNTYEVKSDDLNTSDRVTVFFYEGEPLRTVYGEG